MTHPTEEELIDWLDQKAIFGPITEHLSECPPCQKTIQQLRWILDQTKQLAQTPVVLAKTEQAIFQMIHGPAPKRITTFGWGKFASAALVLISAIGFWMLLSSPFQSELQRSPQLNQVASTSRITSDKNTSENEVPQEKGEVISPAEEKNETPKDSLPKDVLEKIEENKPDPKEVPVENTPNQTVLLTCGDMNQNNQLDAKDPVLFMHRFQQTEEIPLEEGDLNKDGQVNILDLQSLCLQLVYS